MLKAIVLAVSTTFIGPAVSAQTLTPAREDIDVVGVPRAPAQGGPRRWQVAIDSNLGVREAPADDAPTVRSVSKGTVLSNHGCAMVGDRVWCSVGNLHGRMRGLVLLKALRPATGPDGTVPFGVDGSSRRARNGEFDLRGQIPCAQEQGQPLGECTVDVALGGGGDATVVASFSNGFKRTLYFIHGEFIRANATMSGSGSDTDWQMEGGVHLIRVDDQRYELPEDLMVGR